MPARYVVQTLDDLDWPEAETPADVAVELVLAADDGSAPCKATLYLTAEHYAEMRKDLSRWLDLPEQGARRAREAGASRGEATRHRNRLREFADLFGVRNRRNSEVPAYMTATGKNERFPAWLEQEFELWVEAGCPPPGQYKAVA